MTKSRIAPYGTWASLVTAQMVTAGGLRLGGVIVDGEDIYWLEGRPNEGGRYALVRRSADGRIGDVTPPDVNVRTRVHEYGGGSYTVDNGTIYYANFADQRMYWTDAGSEKQDPAYVPKRQPASGEPESLTPPGYFYADFIVDRHRKRLICVREDHTAEGREPTNTLVSIPLSAAPHAGDVIASGYDFYSTPRLSSDGSMLAWLCWRHPNMPWDGTELWIAEVTDTGLRQPRRAAGGLTESIYQPGWSPDGTLYFVSDRTGWWNLYRFRDDPNAPNDPNVEPVLRNPPAHTEFGRPQWILGTSTWAFAGPARIVAAFARSGRWHLALIDAEAGTLEPIATGLEPAEFVAATPTHAALVAGSPTSPDAVVRIDLAAGAVDTLRSASSVQLDRRYFSTATAIEFRTGDGATAHAFYYAPCNPDHAAPPGERPPLIVISHGGPTTAAKATLDLQLQFWTARGFAVADVNYGGSSGYGRPYRQRLNGHWGIVDVDDVVQAAQFLAAQGKADPQRLVIRGGSAGGYTTLAALTFHPGAFKAGASYYGVSDVEALARDTHKFESRYLDTLVGPYPQKTELYRARSPIHFVDRLSCPLILFQGLDDKIVPPNQSEMMADAVRAKGLPVAYLTFEGEQHGFRKAETIIRCLEAELYFYGAIFGFRPAGAIAPVRIDNLPARSDKS